jgi:putative FmdB family regulatory protein
MPTYEYRCKNCDEHLEVVQSFKDEPLTTCPACGGPLRKVFGSIGIAFKGSGFYKTDSRGSSTKSTDGGGTKTSETAPKKPESGGGSGSSGGSGKSESGGSGGSGSSGGSGKSESSTAAS